MEELGRELRQRRIELGYTIEEISAKTSLSTKNIRQLESGDISSFKEDLTYIPFYFKNYCKVLNIDYNDLKSKLDESIVSFTTAMKIEEINQKKELENNIKKNTILTKKSAVKINYGFISFLVIIVMIVLAVGYGILHMFSQKNTITPKVVEEVKKEVNSAPTTVVEPVKEEVKESIVEVKKINQSTYEVKLKKESIFSIVLEEDSWMSFKGSTNPLAEKVYRKGESITVTVKPGEKITARLGVVKNNQFKIDNQFIELDSNLNKNIPQTFEFRFIGE